MAKRFPTILALDLGSNCGYSILDVPRPVPPNIKAIRCQSGLWDLRIQKGDSGGVRFMTFKRFLSEVEPDIIAYEKVLFRQKGGAAAELYGGLVAIVKVYCEEQKIECVGFDTSQVKKRAVGKGGGKGTGKPEVTEAANVFFEIDPPLSLVDKASNKDDNIADAMWVMQCAIDTHGEFIKVKGAKSA